MSDPIYEYSKSKGWQVKPAQIIIRMMDYEVRVIQRGPLPGEHYISVYNSDNALADAIGRLQTAYFDDLAVRRDARDVTTKTYFVVELFED